MFLRALTLGLASATFLITAQSAEAQSRIRDVVDVEGVRQNDLVGYGIVVGLNGTGDSTRNSPFYGGLPFINAGTPRGECSRRRDQAKQCGCSSCDLRTACRFPEPARQSMFRSPRSVTPQALKGAR